MIYISIKQALIYQSIQRLIYQYSWSLEILEIFDIRDIIKEIIKSQINQNYIYIYTLFDKEGVQLRQNDAIQKSQIRVVVVSKTWCFLFGIIIVMRCVVVYALLLMFNSCNQFQQLQKLRAYNMIVIALRLIIYKQLENERFFGVFLMRVQ
ncbi:unnamed protein product [Paramecium primaurelia]|nr:unnamed protein product [Paramecium primaurelia]